MMSMSFNAQPGALERERDGVGRADAHDARLDRGRGRRQDAHQRRLALLFAPGAAADDERRRAVVHARGVARGDHAALEQRLQLGERLQRRVAPRVLVTLERLGRGVLLLRRQGDRQDLALVEPFLLRLGVLLLRGERKGVGCFARDAEVLGDVVAGLRHRMVAVLLGEARIGEARTDRGVVHLHVARRKGDALFAMT